MVGSDQSSAGQCIPATPTTELVREACADVAASLLSDPTLALNEGELQAMLQASLLRHLPDYVSATLGDGCIRRTHHPDLYVPRVFRELKPEGGRDGKEADLLLLQDCAQVVMPKLNGAPARFRPPFSAIIETKLDASAIAMLSGRRVRPRTSDLAADLRKWQAYVDDGRVESCFAVVLTAAPEAYEGLPNVIAIPFAPDAIADWSPSEEADPWPFIDAALEDVADEYRRHPVGCLREKDFESRLLSRLREAGLPKARLHLPDGRAIGIDPVRAQWSGAWSACLGRGRRHDLIVLAPDGDSLLAELELKTSHSDSHNWFRKREVEAELAAMQALAANGLLKRSRFVLFRYGAPLWEDDARRLFDRFPEVEFAYHAV